MKTHTFWFLVLICAIFAGSVPGQGDASNSRFSKSLKPCQIAGLTETVRCGQLTVFEDRKNKKGRTIDLNIVVLPSIGEARQSPLFDLEGGPGMPATKNAGFYLSDGRAYRIGRDIILVDQRGTGRSNPLHCKPLSPSPASSLSELYPVEYVSNCRRELGKTANLALYSTEVAMDDLDDVRAWLGYNKIDLFAISYGTRAAQVFVRRHPRSAGRVVLMGAIGTHHKMPFYHAVNGQRGLDLLLDECLSDTKCGAAFPNIKSELKTLIDSLRRKPAVVQHVGQDSRTAKVSIPADIFAEKLRTLLYSRSGSQEVPYMVHEAAKGNFKPFLDRALARGDYAATLADGMYLSVTCAEDVPFIDEAEAFKTSAETIFRNYRVRQQKRACTNWLRGRISGEFRQPIRSDVDLLIISGAFDPVTPPSWGAEIVKGFPNGRQIVFPKLAHMPDGVSNVQCLDDITLQFLEGKPARKIDASCVATVAAGPFRISEK